MAGPRLNRKGGPKDSKMYQRGEDKLREFLEPTAPDGGLSGGLVMKLLRYYIATEGKKNYNKPIISAVNFHHYRACGHDYAKDWRTHDTDNKRRQPFKRFKKGFIEYTRREGYKGLFALQTDLDPEDEYAIWEAEGEALINTSTAATRSNSLPRPSFNMLKPVYAMLSGTYGLSEEEFALHYYHNSFTRQEQEDPASQSFGLILIVASTSLGPHKSDNVNPNSAVNMLGQYIVTAFTKDFLGGRNKKDVLDFGSRKLAELFVQAVDDGLITEQVVHDLTRGEEKDKVCTKVIWYLSTMKEIYSHTLIILQGYVHRFTSPDHRTSLQGASVNPWTEKCLDTIIGAAYLCKQEGRGNRPVTLVARLMSSFGGLTVTGEPTHDESVPPRSVMAIHKCIQINYVYFVKPVLELDIGLDYFFSPTTLALITDAGVDDSTDPRAAQKILVKKIKESKIGIIQVDDDEMQDPVAPAPAPKSKSKAKSKDKSRSKSQAAVSSTPSTSSSHKKEETRQAKEPSVSKSVARTSAFSNTSTASAQPVVPFKPDTGSSTSSTDARSRSRSRRQIVEPGESVGDVDLTSDDDDLDSYKMDDFVVDDAQAPPPPQAAANDDEDEMDLEDELEDLQDLSYSAKVDSSSVSGRRFLRRGTASNDKSRAQIGEVQDQLQDSPPQKRIKLSMVIESDEE